jgi:hypothetical protein
MIWYCIWYVNDMIWYMLIIWYDMVWYTFKWYLVDTRWQQYSTHLHTNSTQNTENGTYITMKKFKTNLGSAGRALSLPVIPGHFPYNWGKSMEKPQLRLTLISVITMLRLVTSALPEVGDVTEMGWVGVGMFVIISPKFCFHICRTDWFINGIECCVVELFFVGQGAWLYIMCCTCVFIRLCGRFVHVNTYNISILCATQWTLVFGVFHSEAEFSYWILAL